MELLMGEGGGVERTQDLRFCGQRRQGRRSPSDNGVSSTRLAKLVVTVQSSLSSVCLFFSSFQVTC
jgi:hypothetical protein